MCEASQPRDGGANRLPDCRPCCRQQNALAGRRRSGHPGRMDLGFGGDVARLYQRYRRGYPPAVLDMLATRFGLTPQDVVVDLGLAMLLAGCADAVQEDRTISASPDGRAIAMQHGGDGAFVVRDGRSIQIFAGDKDVIATSTPQWSPDGKQVLFTTARALALPKAGDPEHPNAALRSAWDDNPDGRVFQRQAAHPHARPDSTPSAANSVIAGRTCCRTAGPSFSRWVRSANGTKPR